MNKSPRLDSDSVIDMGAVTYAAATNTKYLQFRPFFGQGNSIKRGPHLPQDKGYFFKFNTNSDIKLVRFTLEHNGMVELHPGRVNTSVPNSLRPLNENWMVLWTTQSLKPSFFQGLSKY